MARGNNNADNPELPKLRRFRLAPNGSGKTREIRPPEDPHANPQTPSSTSDDTTVVNFDEVSDEFDESDLGSADDPGLADPDTLLRHTDSQFQASVRPPVPGTRLPAAQIPATQPPTVQPGAQPVSRPPTGANWRTPGGSPGTGEFPTRSQDDGENGGSKNLIWIAAAAAVVVLVGAFVLIARPFGNDGSATDPAGGASSQTTGTSSNPNASDRKSSEAGRLPQESGAIPPNPTGPRADDPGSWASSVCTVIGAFDPVAKKIAADVDDAGTSSSANSDLMVLEQQSHDALQDLKGHLQAIDDADGNAELTAVQTSVIEATSDAAGNVDTSKPESKIRTPKARAESIKSAVQRPKSSLQAEVSKLDEASQQPISATDSCKPLGI